MVIFNSYVKFPIPKGSTLQVYHYIFTVICHDFLSTTSGNCRHTAVGQLQVARRLSIL